MDEAEMNQILKEAFRLYGCELGQISKLPEALKPLVDGNDIGVIVHLNKDNTLRLTQWEMLNYEGKIKTLEKTIKEQTKEIKNLEEALKTLQLEEPQKSENEAYLPDEKIENPIGTSRRSRRKT